MLPSWGCSQSSLIVGIAPILSLSICCASISCRWNCASPVIALQTNVGPILLSISSCGHLTTLTNGNMNSVFASVASGEFAMDHSRPEIAAAFLFDQPRSESAGRMFNALTRQGSTRSRTRSPAPRPEP